MLIQWFVKIIGVALILVIIGPAQAQETTPEVIPPDIYVASADVLFPQAVRFQVVVERPISEIASLTLQVVSPGSEDAVIQINPQSARNSSDTFADYIHIWDIPRATPPRLFDKIVYRWRIITTRDQIIQFEKQVEYTDTRTTWTHDEDARGRIHFTVPFGGPEPQTLRAEVRAFTDLLESKVGRAAPLNILLYGNGLTPGCTRDVAGLPIVTYIDNAEVKQLPCDFEMAEQVFLNSGYIVMEYGPDKDLNSALFRLIFDHFYASKWDNAAIPAWFKEGMWQFYQQRPNGTAFATSQQAIRGGRIFTAAQLAIPPAPTSRDIHVWQAQSYGLILFTANEVGVDKVFQLANEAGTGESFENVYQTVVGQTPDVMISAWASWIFTRQAQVVYNYTPYAATTSTPLPPTETPTPTRTPSPTETPTLTVTGPFTPTPSNTPTPTRTPTSTITPRPAQSFLIGETPTAVPTAIPPAEPVIISREQTAIFGVVLFILAILALLYYRSGSR